MLTTKEQKILTISFALVWIICGSLLLLALTNMPLYKSAHYYIGSIGILAGATWWVLLRKKESTDDGKEFPWGKTVAKVAVSIAVIVALSFIGLHWLAHHLG